MVSMTCSTLLEARSRGDSMRGDALADLRTDGCISLNDVTSWADAMSRKGCGSTIIGAAEMH